MEDNRDDIDFATVPVHRLFRKMFLPTLLGMISMVILNITDGAFVGHGVGSDALAAVNIAAPIFMITSGIGMMFGIGGSVVASIHLSHGNVKAARINITQSLAGAVSVGIVLGSLMVIFQKETCVLFGSNEALVPMASHYLRWIAAFQPLSIIGSVGLFAVRLDGSPKVAMWANVGASAMNIFLDWLLIFPMHKGLEGAAIATSVSFAIAGLCVLLYLLRFSKVIRLYRLKLSWKSLSLSWRNLKYQMKLGSSALLGEIAISCVLIIGNYRFIKFLGEDGVAAFSVGCYCLPIIFMLGNAIVQSVQPIISYGYGAGHVTRLRQALRLAVMTAICGGLLSMAILYFGASVITDLFIPRSSQAWQICRDGLPYFSIGSIAVCINLVIVGYFQSVERPFAATLVTLLRGIVIMLPAFILLPMLLGTPGLWLALPITELTTLMLIGIFWRRTCNKLNNFTSNK
ncbi:MAG: MATE family efflux transporter [Bacteroidaceae bacterium]|nr:MATE family efflux transporter [Bacteroidaceae bacterium]